MKLTHAAAAHAQRQSRREVLALTRQRDTAIDALTRARLVKAGHLLAAARPAPRLRGDRVEVIVSDIHGNKHDPAALAAFLLDLKDINPDRVFLGGDIIDCGGFLAEHHTLGYVAETEDSYETDIAATREILNRIQSAAPRAKIHYLEGNHEWRVERWAVTQRLAHHRDTEMLRRTFAPEFVLDLKARGITYYRQGEHHGNCRVPGWVKLDGLNYVHKLNNARNAADVALGQTAANVVFFDTHRADFQPRNLPGIGLIAAWNPGCLCKRQPLWCNTRPTGWTHGYLVRFIAAGGQFQMVNVSIENGVSFGGALFHR